MVQLLHSIRTASCAKMLYIQIPLCDPNWFNGDLQIDSTLLSYTPMSMEMRLKWSTIGVALLFDRNKFDIISVVSVVYILNGVSSVTSNQRRVSPNTSGAFITRASFFFSNLLYIAFLLFCALFQSEQCETISEIHNIFTILAKNHLLNWFSVSLTLYHSQRH